MVGKQRQEQSRGHAGFDHGHGVGPCALTVLLPVRVFNQGELELLDLFFYLRHRGCTAVVHGKGYSCRGGVTAEVRSVHGSVKSVEYTAVTDVFPVTRRILALCFVYTLPYYRIQYYLLLCPTTNALRCRTTRTFVCTHKTTNDDMLSHLEIWRPSSRALQRIWWASNARSSRSSSSRRSRVGGMRASNASINNSSAAVYCGSSSGRWSLHATGGVFCLL